MKLTIYLVAIATLTGLLSCTPPAKDKAKVSATEATTELEQSLAEEQTSGEYFQSTVSEAQQLLRTEDPRVWQDMMQGQ